MSKNFVKDLPIKPDISRPRWDQGTFDGRVRHFFTITNPLNLLASDAELERSRDIVVKYRYVLLDLPFNQHIACSIRDLG